MGDRKVKFYVATLSDAIQRAARVAPNKGVAFDKAAGIVIDVNVEDKRVEIRSTDLEVFYREQIKDIVEFGDDSATWRLPAELLAGIVAGLPLEKETTFKESDDGSIRIFCGRKQAKLRQMSAEAYPVWDRIDRSTMPAVQNFGQRVAQVAWATSKDIIPFTGIHIDGERITATDRYRLAQVPCIVPISERVTVPLSVLASTLKTLPGEARVAATEKHLLITVGDEIEIMSVLFDANYPNVSEPLRDGFTFEVKVNREALFESITNMMVLVKNERYPVIDMHFEDGMIDLQMEVEQVGQMNDAVEAEFEGTFDIMFTPDYVTKSLDAIPDKDVTWLMGPGKNMITKMIGTDYVAYIQPRRSRGDDK